MLLSCGKKRKPTPLHCFLTLSPQTPSSQTPLPPAIFARVFSLCWNALPSSPAEDTLPFFKSDPRSSSQKTSLLSEPSRYPTSSELSCISSHEVGQDQGECLLVWAQRKGSQKITQLTDNYWNRELLRTLPAAAARLLPTPVSEGELCLGPTQPEELPDYVTSGLWPTSTNGNQGTIFNTAKSPKEITYLSVESMCRPLLWAFLDLMPTRCGNTRALTLTRKSNWLTSLCSLINLKTGKQQSCLNVLCLVKGLFQNMESEGLGRNYKRKQE